MKTTHLAVFAFLCLLLGACRVEVIVPTSGTVTTNSGSMDCAAGSTCALDVADIHFDETFVAHPADGFVFDSWKKGNRRICGNSTEPCHYSTANLEGNDDAIALLSDPDQVLYVEPFFRSTGFNSLFIGHSFFRPFADGMPDHAARAGIANHEQTVVFSGGATGAPEALWENASKGDTIRARLDEGDIELFVMTYHPDYPTLRGYRLWIDYALQNNPNARFVVAVPWNPYPSSITTQTDETTWVAGLESQLHAGIRQMRREYPNNEIFVIPYGQSAWELRKLFDAGQLPEVEVLQSSTRPAIYRDNLGHAREILVELGRLVWLRAIYGIDLETYNYTPPYTTDLKALADRIMDDYESNYDSEYDAPYL